MVGELRQHRDTETIPGYSALLRAYSVNYYHTIIDGLPRVFSLNRSPYANFDEIKLLCPGGPTGLENFFLSKFNLANVRPVSLETDRAYRLEQLIFTPFKTGISSGYLPASYVEQSREKVLPKRPSKCHRVNRGGRGRRRVLDCRIGCLMEGRGRRLAL